MKSANGIELKAGMRGVYAHYRGNVAEAVVTFAHKDGTWVTLLVYNPASSHGVKYTRIAEQTFWGYQVYGQEALTTNQAINNRFWVTEGSNAENDSLRNDGA